MVNIDQLIEEESNKYVSSTALIELGRFCYEGTVTEREAEDMIETASQESFQTGARFVLSKWQEAERWRKVGEHRPAVDEHLMYSYTCLVRLEFGAYAIAVYHSCGAWMESGTEEYLDTVIEWKPIS
ncbi:hypothetical protein [Dysgonomonas mossii]|uniref:Uncharacterized protein n=1 Tax=Dysgonomonas mossii DSM 22836 TaxID=742767 RepID=F8X538_9BACT|nr:hypothetical protein [Dysgonomonas mossii]EGK04736.1 hypothetical protein HMPREF9456_03347 [Dysgonomonas mossii DSM 22836]